MAIDYQKAKLTPNTSHVVSPCLYKILYTSIVKM